jgi:hypothetical protein
MLAKGAFVAFGLSILWIAAPQSASADNVVCPPDPHQPCVIQVGDPGTGGSGDPQPPIGGSGSGQGQCVDHTGQVWPCYSSVFGWWSDRDECYYRLAVPQPPAGDAAWQGHRLGDGAVYEATCPNTPGTGSGTVWMQNPPPGFGGALPPAATLAEQALSRLSFPAARVATAPSEHTFVHLSTFLWIPASQWRSLSATAAIGGRSVTLVATPTAVLWDMGEGEVGCVGPGTPWDPASPDEQTSSCSYSYRTSSIAQPGIGNDRGYAVRVTVTYLLHWQCSGSCDQATGDLPARGVPAQPARLRVLERQSVVVSSN